MANTRTRLLRKRQELSVGGGGLILVGTKHAPFDSPLLFQNGKVLLVKWN
jgi:hypothetical protein